MLPKVCRMNHKNLVFALLKTIQNKLGGILDVFCDYLTAMIGCFFAIAGCAKAKMSTYFSKPNQSLPGNV